MIPFSPPYINEDVIQEVVDSLQSGWITTGPKVKLLEKEVIFKEDLIEIFGQRPWDTTDDIKPVEEFKIPPVETIIPELPKVEELKSNEDTQETDTTPEGE